MRVDSTFRTSQERNLGMPHQDDRDSVTNLQAFKAVFELLIPDEVNCFVRHGNATIKPRLLAAVAIVCWGWTSDSTLDEKMATAWAVVKDISRPNFSDPSRRHENLGDMWR